jgi:RimJ/RimL family protein N-acetyltransferase
VAKPVPLIAGDHVTLRAPTHNDIAKRLLIGRHPEIVAAYGGHFDPRVPFTEEDARAAIQFIATQPQAWVIDVDGFIGHIRFHSFVPSDRRAALAIGIDDPQQLGKGYGTEAINLALRHAFETGLHRVSLRVLATNTRAIRSYVKCGFVEEGREREAALIGGVWHDDVMMAVLDHEFAKIGQ